MTAILLAASRARSVRPAARAARAIIPYVRSVPPPPVTAAIQRFRSLLERRFGARLLELVLFGSYATGSAHEDSDVDVLVVIEELTAAERRLLRDIDQFGVSV